MTYIIDYLVENSDNLQIDYYILPVVNPDGYEHTFLSDRLWRKNKRKGYNCMGVDLNRNFGYRWGGKGTSRNMCSEIYAGNKAFSEPESDAIRNFFDASLANFKVSHLDKNLLDFSFNLITSHYLRYLKKNLRF